MTFDVADQLGSIRLVKFEDLNGNGPLVTSASPASELDVQPGQPPGQPERRPHRQRRHRDGQRRAGRTWRVDEVMQQNWVAVTPTGGQVAVPAGGAGTFTAGNVRPAPLSGTM